MFTIFVACFEKAIESFGTLDIVINNAGIMNDAEWEPMVDVNYVSNEGLIYYFYYMYICCLWVLLLFHRIYNQKGVVHGTILGLNHMGRHKGGKGGTIVNMSSIIGLQGNPLAPIYAGTNFAVVGFTSSLLVNCDFAKQTMDAILCPSSKSIYLVFYRKLFVLYHYFMLDAWESKHYELSY